MSKKTYQLYLKSPHWIRFKKFIYSKRRICQICGNRRRLNIHHLTYENLWHETSFDVIVLCKKCHLKTHAGIIGKDTISWITKNKIVSLNRESPLSHLEKLYKRALKTRDFSLFLEEWRQVDIENFIGNQYIQLQRMKKYAIKSMSKSIKRLNQL